jgi:hypothetical protein
VSLVDDDAVVGFKEKMPITVGTTEGSLFRDLICSVYLITMNQQNRRRVSKALSSPGYSQPPTPSTDASAAILCIDSDGSPAATASVIWTSPSIAVVHTDAGAVSLENTPVRQYISYGGGKGRYIGGPLRSGRKE